MDSDEDEQTSVSIPALVNVLLEFEKIQDDLTMNRINNLFQEKKRVKEFMAHYRVNSLSQRNSIFGFVHPKREREEEEEEEEEEEDEEFKLCKCNPKHNLHGVCLPSTKAKNPKEWHYTKQFMACPDKVRTLVWLIGKEKEAYSLALKGKFSFIPSSIRKDVRSLWEKEREEDEKFEEEEEEDEDEETEEEVDLKPPKLKTTKSL
jgi:hypothetical protein